MKFTKERKHTAEQLREGRRLFSHPVNKTASITARNAFIRRGLESLEVSNEKPVKPKTVKQEPKYALNSPVFEE